MKLRPPFVLSVPHTGTRFLVELLRLGTGYNHVHHRNVAARAFEKHVVVSPLRDPRSVWQSWYTRAAEDGKSVAECYRDFCEAWRLLDEYDGCKPILYVAVDHPEREVHLEVLRRVSEQPLETDWLPVGHQAGPVAPEVNLRGVYGLRVVRRFYVG